MKHRQQNRYKFEGFLERIGRVSVSDAARKVSSCHTLQPQSEDTLFFETLQKWAEQDGTTDFDEFLSSIPCDSLQTYALVLHHKETLVEGIVAALGIHQTTCFEALLELLAALCKDLRNDFRPHFWQSFDALVAFAMANTNVAQKLECCFCTLAVMFKIHWKFVLQHVAKNDVFKKFIPLFSHRRDFMRRFAAEAYAFIVRKHFPAFVDAWYADEIWGDEICENARDTAMAKFMGNLTNHCKPENATAVSEKLLKMLCSRDEAATWRQKCAIKLWRAWLAHRRGAGVGANLAQRLLIVLQDRILHNEHVQGILQGLVVPQGDSDLLAAALHTVLCVLRAPAARPAALHDLIRSVFDQLQKVHIGSVPVYCGFIEDSLDTAREIREGNSMDTLSLAVHCVQKLAVNVVEKLNVDTKNAMLRTCVLNAVHVSAESELPVHRSHIFDAGTVPIVEWILAGLARDNTPEFDDGKIYSLYLIDFCKEGSVSGTVVVPSVLIQCKLRRADLPGVGHRTVLRDHVLQICDKLDVDWRGRCAAWLAYSGLLRVNRTSCVQLISSEMCLEIVRCYPRCFYALSLVRLNFESIGNTETANVVTEFCTALLPALSDCYKNVRMCAIGILAQICDRPQPDTDNKKAEPINENAFEVILTAENCPANIEQYRGRLLQLRKLSNKGYQKYLPEDLKENDQVQMAILAAFFSQLSVNFSHIWDPTIELICSLTSFMNVDTWWPMCQNVLDYYDNLYATPPDTSTPEAQFAQLFISWRHANNEFKAEPKLVALNGSLQVWRALGKMPEVVEKRNRDTVPRLLQAVSTWCSLANDFGANSFCDLTLGPRPEKLSVSGNSDEKPYFRRVLLAILETFSKFRDMKSLYRADKVKAVFEKLLRCPDAPLQIAAVKCIFAYKDKSLLPYSLLYGRSTAASRSKGKSRDSSVRAAIWQYMAGCEPHEFGLVLDQLLMPVEVFSEPADDFDKCKGTLQQMERLFDIHHCVSLASLSRVLRDLDSLCKWCCGRLSPNLSRIVLAALLIGRSAIVALKALSGAHEPSDGDEGINRASLAAAKSLRQSVNVFLAALFTSFEETPWDAKLVRLIIDEMVAPQIVYTKQSNDAAEMLTAPESLLKIFASWARSPKLQTFLLEPVSSANQISEQNCIKVMLSIGASPATSKKSFKIIDSSVARLCDDQSSCEIVASAIAELIAYAGRRFAAATVPPPDLLLALKNVAPLVPSSSACDRLVELLAPQTKLKPAKLRTSAAAGLNVLSTVESLLDRCQEPWEFVWRFVPLFSILNNEECRTALCQIFTRLASRAGSTEVVDWVDILVQLHARDRRRLEKPDYEVRQGAFERLYQRIRNDNQSLLALSQGRALAAAFLHYGAFVLLESDDMALRENARTALNLLISGVVAGEFAASDAVECGGKSTGGGLLIECALLPLIRRGLASKDESRRSDFTTVLWQCAKNDQLQKHVQLVGLSKLVNEKETDLDFLVQMTDIQMHRRSRAMRRLAEKLKSEQDLFGDSRTNTPTLRWLLSMCRPYVSAAGDASQFGGKRTDALVPIPEPVKLMIALLEAFECHLNRSKHSKSSELTMEVDAENDQGDQDGADVIDAGADNVLEENEIVDPLLKIADGILPKLQHILEAKIDKTLLRPGEPEHYAVEELRVARLPLVLALCKLLAALPLSYRSRHLNAVVLKLVNLLRSRSFDTRKAARKGLASICKIVGPKICLPLIIKEMNALLTRGYQAHVMAYSVHSLVTELAPLLQPGDLDACLETLVQTICSEQMGDLSAEKAQKTESEVQNQRTIVEARQSPGRCLDTMQIIGKLVSARNIKVVVSKFYEALRFKLSSKRIKASVQCLRSCATGLAQNQSVELSVLCIVLYDALAGNGEIGGSTSAGKMAVEDSEAVDIGPVHDTVAPCTTAAAAVGSRASGGRMPLLTPKGDCMVLPPEPDRRGTLAPHDESSGAGGSHQAIKNVAADFGLHLLHSILTGGKLKSDNSEHLGLVQPLYELLVKQVDSTQVKNAAMALKCICRLLSHSFPLWQFTDGDSQLRLFGKLFESLSNMSHSAAGEHGRESIELSQATFHAITLFIGGVRGGVSVSDNFGIEPTSEQMRLMLAYCEEALAPVETGYEELRAMSNQTHQRKGAFALLNAILERRLCCPELPNLMFSLRRRSITASDAAARRLCLRCVLKYVRNYAQLQGGHALAKDAITFYGTQLGYELADGRVAALHAIDGLFGKLPMASTQPYALMTFIQLAQCHHNEPNDNAKRICRVTLSNFVKRIPENEGRRNLWNVTINWLQAEGDALPTVASHLIPLFAEAPSEKASTLLPDDLRTALNYMDSLLNDAKRGGQLKAGIVQCATKILRGVNSCRQLEANGAKKGALGPLRKLAAWTLNCVESAAPDENQSQPDDEIEPEHPSDKCGSPPDARLLLAAVRMVGQLLNIADAQFWPHEKVRAACLAALRINNLDELLADQLVKNIIHSSKSLDSLDDVADEFSKICKWEIAYSPKTTAKRSAAFKWLAAMTLCSKGKGPLFESALHSVFPHIFRELGNDADLALRQQPTCSQSASNDIEKDATPPLDDEQSALATLHKLADDTCTLLKSTLGHESFANLLARCQRDAAEKRHRYREERKLTLVADPEMAAKSRVWRQKKKRVAKRRKIEEAKPYKRIKISGQIPEVAINDYQ